MTLIVRAPQLASSPDKLVLSFTLGVFGLAIFAIYAVDVFNLFGLHDAYNRTVTSGSRGVWSALFSAGGPIENFQWALQAGLLGVGLVGVRLFEVGRTRWALFALLGLMLFAEDAFDLRQQWGSEPISTYVDFSLIVAVALFLVLRFRHTYLVYLGFGLYAVSAALDQVLPHALLGRLLENYFFFHRLYHSDYSANLFYSTLADTVLEEGLEFLAIGILVGGVLRQMKVEIDSGLNSKTSST